MAAESERTAQCKGVSNRTLSAPKPSTALCPRSIKCRSNAARSTGRVPQVPSPPPVPPAKLVMKRLNLQVASLDIETGVEEGKLHSKDLE